MLKRKLLPFSGLIAGALSIVLFVLFRSAPEMAEALYGNGIYPLVRSFLDYTFGLLPFPVVYFFPLLILYFIWLRIQSDSKWSAHITSTVNALGWLVAFFYLLWGFNYARPDLSERIVAPKVPISNTQLVQLGKHTVKHLNALRTAELMDDPKSDQNLEKELRMAVGSTVRQYGFDLSTSCRVRLLKPAGILRKLGISGIYFPFTGEGLVEASHPLPEKIFVVAHELAHSFGVTDEGEANLIAYLACTNHSETLVRYSGHLALWEYLYYLYRRKDLIQGFALKENLTPLVLSDLAVLKAERLRYREWIPELGDIVNDTYLKAQGVEDGTQAYLSLPEQVIRHAYYFNIPIE